MSITDSIISALQAAMPALTVHDAHVPRNKDGSPLDSHYVVVYPDLGDFESPTLCATLVDAAITMRLTYVSTTRSNVESFATVARDTLINHTFTGGGWQATFRPDDHFSTTPVSWDESIADRVIMYATDEFNAIAQKVSTP